LVKKMKYTEPAKSAATLAPYRDVAPLATDALVSVKIHF
jgi:hypothetical protein